MVRKIFTKGRTVGLILLAAFFFFLGQPGFLPLGTSPLENNGKEALSFSGRALTETEMVTTQGGGCNYCEDNIGVFEFVCDCGNPYNSYCVWFISYGWPIACIVNWITSYPVPPYTLFYTEVPDDGVHWTAMRWDANGYCVPLPKCPCSPVLYYFHDWNYQFTSPRCVRTKGPFGFYGDYICGVQV